MRTISRLVAAVAAACVTSAPSVNAQGFRVVNLVSSVTGGGGIVNTNLVGPASLAIGPGPRLFVVNAGAGDALTFLTSGRAAGATVSIPSGLTDTNGSNVVSVPSSVIFNSFNTGFVFTGLGPTGFTNTASSTFMFATSNGTISAFNRAVNTNTAFIVAQQTNSIFAGMTIAQSSLGPTLFVTDFKGGFVQAYDSSFSLVNTFTDTNLPSGFAPFGIANIGGLLFVTFVQQVQTSNGVTIGTGGGFVDIFDTEGDFVRRFASNSVLNAPVTVALAGTNFGQFSRAVLVGNFGTGNIAAFDRRTGRFLGLLRDRRNVPIAISGLQSLAFSGSSNLFFVSSPTNSAIFGNRQGSVLGVIRR